MTSPTAAPSLPSRLSPSALTRYRTCPKQFFLCDIERVGERQSRSPTLTIANAIHEALQLFYGLSLEYRSADNLERCLRSVWVKHRGDAFNSRAEEASAGLEAIQLLRSYSERVDITIEPLARERWVGVRVGDTNLYGKIDRVDRRGDGLDLIDYKTGRRALDAIDLRHESAVQVYVLGAEKTFNLSVNRVRLIYLALGTETVWEPEREDVADLGEKLCSTLREMAHDTAYEARPGQHCNFCPAQLSCPDKDLVAIEDVAESARATAEQVPF
jgi:RecB family exonuclease